jgi:hypothetical protein
MDARLRANRAVAWLLCCLAGSIPFTSAGQGEYLSFQIYPLNPGIDTRSGTPNSWRCFC